MDLEIWNEGLGHVISTGCEAELRFRPISRLGHFSDYGQNSEAKVILVSGALRKTYIAIHCVFYVVLDPKNNM